MARSKSDSWTMAGRSPDSCIKRPASFASCTPRSLSGTSFQPVNRFSRFQARRVIRRAAGEARLDLRRHHLIRGARVVMVGQLTHAHDHAQLARQRRRRLLGHHLVCLSDEEPALRMADDDPLTERLEHRGRNLARESAGHLPEGVLPADLDTGLEEQFRDLSYAKEWMEGPHP